jgi:hypothetical protein
MILAMHCRSDLDVYTQLSFPSHTPGSADVAAPHRASLLCLHPLLLHPLPSNPAQARLPPQHASPLPPHTHTHDVEADIP